MTGVERRPAEPPPTPEPADAASTFRATPAFRHLHLIALTGWGSEDERRRSREAGFDDHWVKSVEPERLRQFLARDPGSS